MGSRLVGKCRPWRGIIVVIVGEVGMIAAVTRGTLGIRQESYAEAFTVVARGRRVTGLVIKEAWNRCSGAGLGFVRTIAIVVTVVGRGRGSRGRRVSGSGWGRNRLLLEYTRCAGLGWICSTSAVQG